MASTEENTPATAESPAQISDTGKKKGFHYGWVVFIGACLMMIPESMPMNTAAVFFTPVSTDLGIPLSSFSLTISIVQLAIFVSIGTLTKWFNKMNIKLFMSLTIIVEAACFFVFSVATNIWVFYIASFFNGCCMGILVYLVVPVLVNNWFSTRVATLIGAGTCIQGLSGALFTYIGGVIIAASGWRTAYLVFAIIVLAVGLPVSIFMLSKRPEDKGLLPVGYDASRIGSSEGKAIIYGLDHKKAIKQGAFILLVITQCLFAISIMFNNYLNTYAQSLGLGVTIAALISSLVMVGMAVGKIIVGAIADHTIPGAYIFGCSCAIVALPVIALVAGTNATIIVICSVLFGVAYATATVLGAATTRALFGPKDYASNWATVGGFTSLLGAFGTFFWAFIITGNGGGFAGIGYTSGLLLATAFFVATLACALVAIHMGRKLKKLWTDQEGNAIPEDQI